MDIRKAFRPAGSLSDAQKIALEGYTEVFTEVASFVNGLPECREKSICLTKLQEAKMWAIECVTKVGA